MLKTLVILLFVLANSAEALAYLDPGRGSGLQQLIANGLSGLIALIGSYFRAIFRKK